MATQKGAKAGELSEDGKSGSAKRIFPVWLLILVVLGGIAIALLQTFASDIETAIGLDPVWLNICSALIILLLTLIWFFSILFRSRLSLLPRLFLAALPAAMIFLFFVVFRPVNDGDGMGIHHFEPIWKKVEPVELTTVESTFVVDLNTETRSDFQQFLGPNRTGVINHLPAINRDLFATETRELWKQPIGAAWSGFSVRNGYAVTMEQRGQQECVTCYDIQSGALQWIYEQTARHQDMMNLGHEGPRSTPTIDEGRVYALGGNGIFVCLDGSNGELIWKHDLAEMLKVELIEGGEGETRFEYENSTLAWGHAGSPLIVEGMVIIPGGGPRVGDKVTLLGFDKVTGNKVWQAGTDMISYSSPTRANLAGIDQILIVAEAAAVGYALADGRELWRYEREGTSETAANCSQITVTPDGLLLLTKGYGLGGELIELEPNGDILQATRIWKKELVLKTKLSNPVLLDGYAYSLSDGFLECTDLDDGERVWKRRGRFGHGQLLLIDDLLLVHSEYGELFLIEASSDEYKEIGSIKTIKGVCWNTICLAGKYCLVRSEVEAACYELPLMSEVEPVSNPGEPSGNE